MINLETFIEFDSPDEYKQLKMKEHEEKIQREIHKEKERKKMVAKQKKEKRERLKAMEILYPHTIRLKE